MLPPQFPRTVIHHDPDNTQCACGCQLQRIGEDVSEKLDYTPGLFTVEQQVRGKWACRQCETLIQAPVPSQVIDKGIPTAGLLAQRVVHAAETPVQMLAPGEKKTRRAYVWAYSSTPFSALKAVVYDFNPSRAGEHARNFLGTWNGKLLCDDFAGYKASFEQGITEIGCMAHARRKFFDLHVANKIQLTEQALHSIGGLYEVERHAKEMSEWMLAQREFVPEGSATVKALDYSLKRWVALTRYLEDGAGP